VINQHSCVKHSPSLLEWKCFSFQGRESFIVLNRNERVNTKRYLKIIGEVLLNQMSLYQTLIFQQDGAPCHMAKVCKKWLADQGIELLD
jgi:hypothetical protein